jgi:DNA end-binding protein Ku
MAPRAYWKGYLKLSLVSCPILLYPATSEREKVRFHQIHKETGNRVRYKKIDEETGDEVEQGDIIKGYEASKGSYIELTPEELEAVAVESTRVIDIEQFVPKKEIDDLYMGNPYYIVPDGEVGQQAFAVIREAIKEKGMVAIGRVVFTSREHVIALEPRGKGMMGLTIRYAYEVRDEKEYFEDMKDEKISKEMMDLASHIVKTKQGHFEPKKYEDRYEEALKDLLKKKAGGETIEKVEHKSPSNVVNLMDALRASVGGKAEKATPTRRKAERANHRAPKQAGRSTARHRKAAS